MRTRGQGAAPPPRDARQAGRRRDQRRRARRRPRDLPGLPPPRSRSMTRRSSSASPRSARPAARRRRRRAHGAHARHRRRADVAAAAGPAPPSRQGHGARDRRRARVDARGARARRQGVDQGQPRGVGTAVGRRGLQDPRRHAVQPEARAEPAGVPGQPAQAAQGRQLPRAAPHHGRGGRGRPGRLRQRDRDRGPLLRRPGHRPGRQEHDPGVLLRPAARQRRSRPSRGDRARSPRRRSSCSARA